MNKATLIKFTTVFLMLNLAFSKFSKAQTPTNCLEIESILVDACGTPEGENEMVRFKVGPSAIATSNLSVTWPNNSFLGISPVNATTTNIVNALNATILSCGYLLQPTGGLIPAGKSVLLITSTNVSLSANSFANLTDTLYVIFQNAGNTSGHFANYSTPSGLRTLVISLISPACSDAVTYDKVLLVNQSGTHGGSSALNDGATVEFSWPGIANYVNNGCQAPISTLTSNAGANATTCSSGNVPLTGTATGNYTGVIWQGGQGTFSSSDSLNTTYSVSPSESGTITLSLGVIGHCHDTVFSTVNITVNPAPTATITPSGSTTFCQGNSVTLTASGAGTYSWSTGSSATSITVSTSGTYTLTSSNSCGSQTATQTVTVNPLPTAAITVAGSASICPGDSVILIASGAGTFSWSTGSTNDSITALTAGTYTLTATNSCGSQTATQVVTVGALPIAAITPGGSTNLCTGDSVTLTASGGSAYAWSTGSTSPSITVSTSGTYTVTASNGCGSQTATQSVLVSSPPTAAITTGGTTTLCPGDSIILNASGTGSFSWSTGATSTSITVFTAGTYTLTSTTSCGTQTATQTITPGALPIPVITASGSTNICTGDSVTLTASGGSAYAWSTGVSGASITVSSGGTYTVNAGNSCGFVGATQTVSVSAPPLVTAHASAISFCPGNTVILYATGTGNYSWTGGSTNDSITVSTGGTYVVTATSSCGSITDNITVSLTPLPVAVITPSGSTAICPGSSVTLNASGGTSYTWLPTGSSGSSVSANTAGTYTLTATNSCGSNNTTINITSLSLPVASVTAASSTTICAGDNVVLNASGGGSYVWSTGQTGSSITASADGTYWVATSNSCGSDSSFISVNVDSITAFFTADVYTGTAPLLVNFNNASSASATGFAWTFGDNSSGSAISPSNTYGDPGTYVVTLTATNSLGCTDSYSATIIVLENPSGLVMPNVFTPNGDHNNDQFQARGFGIAEFTCTIYDRWGIKMTELPTFKSSWDGRTSSGSIAADGTYYYIVKAKGEDGKIYDQQGFVQLISN